MAETTDVSNHHNFKMTSEYQATRAAEAADLNSDVTKQLKENFCESHEYHGGKAFVKSHEPTAWPR